PAALDDTCANPDDIIARATPTTVIPELNTVNEALTIVIVVEIVITRALNAVIRPPIVAKAALTIMAFEPN
ncbi:hypothetical protein ACQ0P6_04830, partial [Streptococcus canis]|uniref:hypothetical protein n=1 Tax=Streptococcus canis TaxID=1329 RepID=UPI0040365018